MAEQAAASAAGDAVAAGLAGAASVAGSGGAGHLSPAERRERAWQAYLQPNGTLVNKLGLADPRRLAAAERSLAARRQVQLESGAAGPFAATPAGYRALHRHLFGDVYAWAGLLRTVDMDRQEPRPDGTLRRTRFVRARDVETGLRIAFDQLRPALPRLREEAARPPHRRDARLVATVAAAHAGALNYVHAFRDGNGRAMRARVWHLARAAGLGFDAARLDRPAWDEASHRAATDASDLTPLASVIGRALEPLERTAERGRSTEHQEKATARPPSLSPGARAVMHRRPPGRDGHELTD